MHVTAKAGADFDDHPITPLVTLVDKRDHFASHGEVAGANVTRPLESSVVTRALTWLPVRRPRSDDVSASASVRQQEDGREGQASPDLQRAAVRLHDAHGHLLSHRRIVTS